MFCRIKELLRINSQEVNPFVNMTPVQFKSMRSIVVECVLATDMAAHFQQVSLEKLYEKQSNVSLISRTTK